MTMYLAEKLVNRLNWVTWYQIQRMVPDLISYWMHYTPKIALLFIHSCEEDLLLCLHLNLEVGESDQWFHIRNIIRKQNKSYFRNIYIYIWLAHWLSGRVFTNGLGAWGLISKTQKKWYLIPPCLTLSIIGYISRIDIYIYIWLAHWLSGKVFTNGLGAWGLISKTQKNGTWYLLA